MPTAAFLFFGITASVLGWPWSSSLKARIKPWGSHVLQVSVVLLGARIPISAVLDTGIRGLAMSLLSAALILIVGLFLSRRLSVPQDQSVLITSGTAICGGSAIAAVAPTIQAKSLDVGVSIAVVFILNAIAAFVFPPMGRWIGLTDTQFATWAALAIHDTSSVVAAGTQWSEEALKLATTIKLSRTLWIFPLLLFFSYWRNSKDKSSSSSWKPPWFILGFVLLSTWSTFIPGISTRGVQIFLREASHWGFSLSLFLIGGSIPKEHLKSLSWRPLLFGLTLWILTLVGALLFVSYWV